MATLLTAPDMTSDTAIAVLVILSDPSLPIFARRFKDTAHNVPGPEASAIYVSAQLNGLAVRKARDVDSLSLLRLLL